MPEIDRDKPLNDDVVLELYNRYLLMLDELNNYRGKILYFFKCDDEKGKEKILEIQNLDFDKRLRSLEFY